MTPPLQYPQISSKRKSRAECRSDLLNPDAGQTVKDVSKIGSELPTPTYKRILMKAIRLASHSILPNFFADGARVQRHVIDIIFLISEV